MRYQGIFFWAALFFGIFGAGEVQAKPSYLQAGEWMRFRARAGGVEGGHLTILLRDLQRVGKTHRLSVEMVARTNNFFDKIHYINNRFQSRFFLEHPRDFRFSVDVHQAGFRQKRSMISSPQPHALAGVVGRRRGVHGVRLASASPRRFVALSQRRFQVSYTPWDRKGKQWMRPYGLSYTVPQDTRDLVSSLFFARSLPMRVGRSFRTHLFVMGQLWRIEGHVRRKARIDSLFGMIDAYQLDAKGCWMPSGRQCKELRVWVSADASRVPIKIESSLPIIGRVQAELVSYQRSFKARRLHLAPPSRSPLFFGRGF
jgi:hypothetical protein